MNLLIQIKNKLLSSEIIRKGTGAFFFRILGSLLGYIFLILVTRSFGAETWGVFALCLAVLQISSMLGKFGIDIALLKFVAHMKDSSLVKGVAIQSLFLVSLFAIIMSVFIYNTSDYIALYFFKKSYLSSFIKLVSYAIYPFILITVVAQIFRGMIKIKEFAFIEYVSKFLFSILFFFLLVKFYPIQDLYIPIYSFLCAIITVSVFTCIYLFSYFKNIVTKYTLLKTQIIRTAFPMMLSTSIFLLMSWSDTIMLGIYTSDFNVGIYNVALKISMVTVIILGAVNSILAPKLSETFNNNKLNDFKKLIIESTKIISLSTIPIVIILFIFPDFFLTFFGKEFIKAKTALYILLIGQCINALSGSVGFILQMTGNEKLFQNILLCALIINISLNYILIPIYGIKGAAFSSVFSMIIWNLSSVFFVYKKFNILTFFRFGYLKK